jgi:hypothetical protein
MEWSVTVYWDCEPEVTQDLLFDIAAIGGAVGGRPGEQRVDTTMTVAGPTAGAAVSRAAERIAGVAPGRLACAEVMTTDEADRRLSEPAVPELVGIQEVAELLEVTKQRASSLRRLTSFPRPVAQLASGPIWLRSDLTTFERSWDRRPGRKRRHAQSTDA